MVSSSSHKSCCHFRCYTRVLYCRIIQELILFLCLDLTALESSFHDVPFPLTEPTEIFNAQHPDSTKENYCKVQSCKNIYHCCDSSIHAAEILLNLQKKM